MRANAILILLLCAFTAAQEKPKAVETPRDAQANKSEEPQVKINYLNVCAPSQDEQHVLDNALSSLPSKPAFATDFEVARGRSTMPEEGPGAVQSSAPVGTPPPISKWVRIRREFASGGLSNVQYTFSRDATGMNETLVFRFKSPKRDQPMQISLQDALAGPGVSQALATDTTPNRIRVERFGGSSVVLARCPQADQKQYEPYFTRAHAVMTTYRRLLNVRQTVPTDLAKVQ